MLTAVMLSGIMLNVTGWDKHTSIGSFHYKNQFYCTGPMQGAMTLSKITSMIKTLSITLNR
jgi:hypothetical protein